MGSCGHAWHCAARRRSRRRVRPRCHRLRRPHARRARRAPERGGELYGIDLDQPTNDTAHRPATRPGPLTSTGRARDERRRRREPYAASAGQRERAGPCGARRRRRVMRLTGRTRSSETVTVSADRGHQPDAASRPRRRAGDAKITRCGGQDRRRRIGSDLQSRGRPATRSATPLEQTCRTGGQLEADAVDDDADRPRTRSSLRDRLIASSRSSCRYQ